jgi:glucose dehydrogenase
VFVLQLQQKQIAKRNEVQKKLMQKYITIRVTSEEEQTKRRNQIADRRSQIEQEKRDRVVSLKNKWHQEQTVAKLEHHERKHKRIQELRSQNVLYYYEASLNTQRKEDLKKLVEIDKSKIAALLNITKDKC